MQMYLPNRSIENVAVKTIPLSGVGASRIYAPRARNMCFAFCNGEYPLVKQSSTNDPILHISQAQYQIFNGINLGIYFPPVVDQGISDACQSYSAIYYIANYYLMLERNNLTTYDYYSNKSSIINYYSLDENILNPLYVFTHFNGAVARPRLHTWGSANILSFAESRCKTVSNFNMVYNPPDISSNNLFIDFPPSINNDVFAFPFKNNTPYITLFDRSSYNDYKKTFTLNNIKRYLNNGYPIWWSIYLNSYVRDVLALVKVNFPSITTINDYNNLNLGIWYCSDNLLQNISPQSIILDKLGAHDIVIVGYLDSVATAKEVDESDGVFIFVNQWGTQFATNGYGYITYNYFFNAFNNDGFHNNGSPTDKVRVLPPSFSL